jgi:hypothetical protein
VSFNVPSTFNRWWENNDWKQMYGCCTEYGSHEHGLTLDLEVDDG